MGSNKLRVLIVFNAGATVYGMERGVIETFDLLRPEVEPHFLMSYTTKRLDLPILREIKERGLSHSFLSDWTDWPRIGKPNSLREAWAMSLAMIRGNRDVLKAARGMDVIYIPGVNYFYFAILAAVLHRLRGRRIIYQFHDLIAKRSRRLRLASFFVTDVVHNTRSGQETVTESNSYLQKKNNWIIPFTEGRRVNSNGGRAFAFDSGRHILFVGQVAAHKGVHLLLDALELLGGSELVLTLDIVGTCNEEDLERRISKVSRNGSHRVRYWGYQEDVLPMMQAADVYVHPSPPSLFQESFGRGVVEAMSVSTPPVCFKSGSLAEIVIDNQTGLVCEEETAECLAANISKLLDDERLRNRLAIGARESYEARFSPTTVKAGWLSLCRSLV